MHPTPAPEAPTTMAASAPTAPRIRVPLPEGVDRRRRPAVRLVALANQFAAALGHQPSDIEVALIVDAAALARQSESLAERAAAGELIDVDQQVRVSGALARALDRLGIGAGSKPAEEPKPDLRGYLDGKAAEKAAQGRQDAAA